MDPKLIKKHKKRLIKNVITLRNTLDACLDAGLVDFESVFYNQLESLEEEIHASENVYELKELSGQGQNFEKQLCVLYDNAGLSTTNLDWPELPEEENF